MYFLTQNPNFKFIRISIGSPFFSFILLTVNGLLIYYNHNKSETVNGALELFREIQEIQSQKSRQFYPYYT